MSKNSTPLTYIAGIGPAAAAVLVESGFPDVEAVAKSDLESLCAVRGFGSVRAASVLAAAQSLVPVVKGEEPKENKNKKEPKGKKKEKKDKKLKKDKGAKKPGKGKKKGKASKKKDKSSKKKKSKKSGKK